MELTQPRGPTRRSSAAKLIVRILAVTCALALGFQTCKPAARAWFTLQHGDTGYAFFAVITPIVLVPLAVLGAISPLAAGPVLVGLSVVSAIAYAAWSGLSWSEAARSWYFIYVVTGLCGGGLWWVGSASRRAV